MFWRESLKERRSLEDLEVDEKVILKRNLNEIRWEVADWIHVFQCGGKSEWVS